ncbi:MAG: hypothetical protein ACOCWB_02480 [Bacteroidota bacterium]
MKHFFLLFVLFISYITTYSQDDYYISDERRELFFTEIMPEAFDDTLMRDAIFYHINQECEKLGIRQFRMRTILEYTAMDMADYIAKREISRINDISERKQIKTRLYEYDYGNTDANEIILKSLVKRGRTLLTYDEVGQDVAYIIFSRTKLLEIAENPRYTFIGIAARLDEEGKRAYISLNFGNYSLESLNKKELKNADLPITTYQYFLDGYDERACRKSKIFPDIYALQQNISVKDGVIWFETDDYRTLRKLLRYPKDGLAVDIVMWKQYPCDGDNLINTIMLNKGHMTKPVYNREFEKENEYQGRVAKDKLKIKLGTIPEGVRDYELNLVIILDKYVCASLIPPYIMPETNTTLPKAKAFPDTITPSHNAFRYIPRQDTAIVSFTIPFDKGKSQYKKEDIQAFIDSLDQPHFHPLSFKITAYSSIDGDPQRNMELRGERILSIKRAIEEYSENSVPITTESSDSWSLFYSDIVGTDFQFLRPKSKKEVLRYLKQGDNKKMLEPILAKHRFAKIDIRVRYDISTVQKEQDYVLYLFNKALQEYDIDKALAIQKYIIEQVLRKRYTRLAVDKMNIPNRFEYAGILMNKLWLDYEAREVPIDEAYVIELRRLNRMSPENAYIRRNLVFARLQIEVINNDSYVIELQREIDDLMNSSLPKYVIDPVNLQLQILSIEALGENLKISNEDKFIEEAFDRIKNIIEIDKTDWQGAYNLAVLFTSMGDYEYPLSIMTPMIHNPNIDENFIFMFISICTHTNYMRYTEVFEQALQRAYEINPKKLCELIDTGKISFQIMDNPEVKKFYCNACGH